MVGWEGKPGKGKGCEGNACQLVCLVGWLHLMYKLHVTLSLVVYEVKLLNLNQHINRHLQCGTAERIGSVSSM